MAGNPSHMVVLIHGLGRTSASMWLLERRLRRWGLQTCRLGYPSTKGGINASESYLRTELAGLGPGPLDLVGHSLGGLLSARLLRDPQGLEIRRVVQLGTPNLGSPLVDRMGGIWPVRRLCGPAVAELRSHTSRHPPDPRIGAIAGTAGFPGIPLRRPHDGGVTARSAWAGAGHRAAIPVLHSALPISSRAAKLTLQFLTNGRFETPRL